MRLLFVLMLFSIPRLIASETPGCVLWAVQDLTKGFQSKNPQLIRSASETLRFLPDTKPFFQTRLPEKILWNFLAQCQPHDSRKKPLTELKDLLYPQDFRPYSDSSSDGEVAGESGEQCDVDVSCCAGLQQRLVRLLTRVSGVLKIYFRSVTEEPSKGS